MVENIGVLCKRIILMNLGSIGINLIKFGVEMIWRSNQFADKNCIRNRALGVRTPRNGRSDVEVSGKKVLLAERPTFKHQETGRLNVGHAVSECRETERPTLERRETGRSNVGASGLFCHN